MMIDNDGIEDLGSVTEETKQTAPWPPYYWDWLYGYGTEPW
jgi:hypothetical protein